MDKTPKEQRLRNIICRGLEHLTYTQNTVVDKMDTLGHHVSAPTLTNIKLGIRGVKPATLETVAAGIQELLQLEMDMIFDERRQDFRLQHSPQ